MADSEFTAFLKELLEPLGGITTRKMFGGLSVYRDGVVFALADEGALYLKADDDLSPDFEAEGCGPFTYAAKDGRVVSMCYWRLPERLYDEPDELREWCLRSLEAARRLDAAKASKKKVNAAKASKTRASKGE